MTRRHRSQTPGVEQRRMRCEGDALLVPPSLWYAAVLKGLPPNPPRSQLIFAFEPWLPIELDDVEARFVRVDAGWLAVGIEREVVVDEITRAELDGRPIESVRLEPGSLGEGLPSNEDLIRAIRQVDFRSGHLQSPRARRRARNQSLLAAASFIGIGLAASLGLVRRAHLDLDVAARADGAVEELARSVAGPSRQQIDPLQRLQIEHRHRTVAETSSSVETGAEDRSWDYIRLLASWPDRLSVETEQLRVDQEVIEIRSRTRTLDDHERLVVALGGVVGWRVASASGSASGDAVRSSIVLRTQAPPGEGTSQR